jgi:hypothetical protein
MRRVVHGGLALALVIGLTATVQSPAAAQSVVDGCTAVPDSGPSFDFTEACDAHDDCYINQPHGSSADDRRQCDREFRDAMFDSCRDLWPKRSQAFSRGVCFGVAWVYYLGVRAFGDLFWEAADPATPLAA